MVSSRDAEENDWEEQFRVPAVRAVYPGVQAQGSEGGSLSCLAPQMATSQSQFTGEGDSTHVVFVAASY